MNITERIDAVQSLIKKREEIDRQLAELFSGGSVSRKTNKCGTCGQEGHSTRTCPNKTHNTPTEAEVSGSRRDLRGEAHTSTIQQSPPPQNKPFMAL